jgi:TRAP-type C4-dicarboxylate transport system permease small subunit
MSLEGVSAAYGRLLEALALVASLLLFALMLIVCGDVLLRNVPLIPSVRGIGPANDLSEACLYLITLLVSPWLLRQGQHIRVDILLRAIPRTLAWGCEWLVDVLGLACCLVIAWYGVAGTLDAWSSGEMFIKSLATPVWWWLAVLPVTFLMLALEFVFRMQRLARAPHGPREEAVSAG